MVNPVGVLPVFVAMTGALSGKQSRQVAWRATLTASLILAGFALTLICLIGAKKVMAFLGNSGNKVLMRLMGLIVMVIAVEFFFAGLRPLVPGLFK